MGSGINRLVTVRIILVLSDSARPRARNVEVGYSWLWDGWSLIEEPKQPMIRDKLLVLCKSPGCAATNAALLANRDSYVLYSGLTACTGLGKVLVHASIYPMCGLGTYIHASEVPRYAAKLVKAQTLVVIVSRGRGYSVEAALAGVYNEEAHRKCLDACGVNDVCDVLCRIYSGETSIAERIITPS